MTAKSWLGSVAWPIIAFAVAMSGCDSNEIFEDRIVPFSPYADDAKIAVENLQISFDETDASYVLSWTQHPSAAIAAYRIARTQLHAAENADKRSAPEKNVTYDNTGRRVDWHTSPTALYKDNLSMTGLFSYTVFGVFPDGSMTTPSAQVSVTHIVESAPSPFVPQPDVVDPGDGIDPDPEPCVPIETYFDNFPDLICVNILVFSEPGTDDTLESAVVPTGRALVAVTQISDLRPHSPENIEKRALSLGFTAGEDGILDTVDDGIWSFDDMRELTASHLGVVNSYAPTEPSRRCIKPHSDLNYYEVFSEPALGQNSRKRFVAPGEDGQWNTADDRLSAWYANVISDGNIVDETLHTLPGSDLAWFTHDDFQKYRTQYLFDTSGKLTQVVLYDAPGGGNAFGSPGDVSAAVTYYSYDVTGNLLSILNYRMPGHVPTLANFIEFTDVLSSQSIQRRVTAGTDQLFGTSDDVPFDLLRTQEIPCPSLDP